MGRKVDIDGLPADDGIRAGDELEATKAVVDELAQIIADKERRVRALETALLRARRYGVASTGFNGGVCVALGDWIDAGMQTHTLPRLPDHLSKER